MRQRLRIVVGADEVHLLLHREHDESDRAGREDRVDQRDSNSPVPASRHRLSSAGVPSGRVVFGVVKAGPTSDDEIVWTVTLSERISSEIGVLTPVRLACGTCTTSRLSTSAVGIDTIDRAKRGDRRAGRRHDPVLQGVRPVGAVDDLQVVEVRDRAVVQRREHRARLSQDQHVDVRSPRDQRADGHDQDEPDGGVRLHARGEPLGPARSDRLVRRDADQARSAVSRAASRRRRHRCTPRS